MIWIMIYLSRVWKEQPGNSYAGVPGSIAKLGVEHDLWRFSKNRTNRLQKKKKKRKIERRTRFPRWYKSEKQLATPSWALFE